MGTDKTFKVIKPHFGSKEGAHETGRQEKTKRKVLEEIEAMRRRLVELERIAGEEALAKADPPFSADGGPHEECAQKEIDRRLELESALEKKERLLHLIFNLSTNFMYLPSDEIDGGIKDVLSIVGQFSDAGRTYVFLFDANGTKVSNTHEWCHHGVTPYAEELQHLPTDDFPWLFERIRNLEIVQVPDVSELPPEAEKEKKEWEREGIQSIICIPIVHGFELIGFFGLDSVAAKKTWPDDMIFLFRMVGEFFAGAFVQRKAEEELRESATRYRTLFEYANDSIFLMKDGNFFDCNSETLRLFKCAREAIIGSSIYEFSPECQPDGRDSKEKIIEKTDTALAGKPQFFEWRFRSGNGTLFDADVSLNKIELGVEILIQAIVRDVTIRKRWEQALRDSEERYRSLFDDSRDAIYITRKDGSFVDMNQSFLDLFGYAREELLRVNAKDAYLSPEDLEAFKKVMKEKGFTKDYEVKLKKRGGEVMDCLVTVMTKQNENRQTIGYQGIIRDITATKKAEETIRHMAYHDALTGLPNRVLFDDRLAMATANAQRHGKAIAVMMLDLDKFKQVNDVLGHKVGDLLLKAVAGRLTRTLRKSDTVARMGGDEFVVILPEMAREYDAGIVAQKIIEVFQQPFKLDSQELSVTTSVGVAIFPQDGKDPEALVKHADIAMYYSKGIGRNKYSFYSDEMTDSVKKA
ncbi:MAG TPA: diguanylate cyclase [Syntrophorhabdaceae bacterium]|nr:diguanylate cyclase [Syntrophorhabdaceae bacterium]